MIKEAVRRVDTPMVASICPKPSGTKLGNVEWQGGILQNFELVQQRWKKINYSPCKTHFPTPHPLNNNSDNHRSTYSTFFDYRISPNESQKRCECDRMVIDTRTKGIHIMIMIWHLYKEKKKWGSPRFCQFFFPKLFLFGKKFRKSARGGERCQRRFPR